MATWIGIPKLDNTDSKYHDIVTIITLVIAIMLGGMGAWNMFLVSRNWTMIEASILHQTGHYTGLGFCKAFKLTFGDNPLLWMVPVQGPSATQGL
jgi:uncharacterized membrane protein